MLPSVLGIGIMVLTTLAQSLPGRPVRITLSRLPMIGHAEIAAEFRLSEAGGSITLMPVSPGDTAGRDAIRRYGELVQQQLIKGDNSALAALASATAESAAQMKTDRGVAMSVQQIPSGIVLNFAASDQSSRTAVHNYLRIARGQPELTPEERALNHPGNNLGWDAPKSDNLQK